MRPRSQRRDDVRARPAQTVAMMDSYRVTIPYTRDYQAELDPLRARLVLLRAGFRPPAVGTAWQASAWRQSRSSMP